MSTVRTETSEAYHEGAVAPSEKAAAAAHAGAQRRILLALLTIIYALNYLDRQIVAILQEPIKAEFGLADWQLGVLTGASVGILYAICGLPIGR